MPHIKNTTEHETKYVRKPQCSHPYPATNDNALSPILLGLWGTRQDLALKVKMPGSRQAVDDDVAERRGGRQYAATVGRGWERRIVEQKRQRTLNDHVCEL